MDMYPKEWSELGLSEKGPNDAQVRPVWIGEGYVRSALRAVASLFISFPFRVYQMSILEAESTGEGTPQGVVLALVGPDDDSPKDQESVRALRMYNLASLVSLAKWAVVQKVRTNYTGCCISKCSSLSDMRSLGVDPLIYGRFLLPRHPMQAQVGSIEKVPASQRVFET